MVRIHLSDGSFFVLQAEVYARQRLHAGDVLASGRIEALCAESELVAARQKALGLLARAPQSTRGLAQKLAARGFSRTAVDAAVARVTELGYLDDTSFAENWVRSRLAARREGFASLYKGLLARGIPRGTAEAVLCALYDPEAEMESARSVVEGMQSQAAARRLASRGFRARTISRILKEIRRGGREAGEP
jgi:regulatory protein